MTIRLTDAPEPLTPAAKDATQLILAESAASRQLQRILRRYLQRKVKGRSILISGHRGSGKTTLVRKAVQEAKGWAAQRGENRIPLLISLHGPDLLPTSETAREQTEGNLDIDGEDHHRVLKRITVGLYRALGKEMSFAFRRQVTKFVGKPKAVPGNRSAVFIPNDLGELAAHFELTLDGHLELDELRELWRKMDGLTRGILFPEPKLADQGIREIVALASAAKAYRRITGREESRRLQSSTDHQEEERRWAPGNSSPNLQETLFGLFSGTAIGVSILQNYPLAGIAAVATAIATRSLSRLRLEVKRRTVAQEILFFPDTSPATLERELPILIDRLDMAGLSPVFLIDELDKVEQLQTRMVEVIHHLKHLAAAGGFFCFLTDRDYFEEIRRRSIHYPYPREHTYFNDRLFMLHRPSDLRQYLARALKTDMKTGDRMALGMLSYALLCRSCLHPVDLRRELRRLADGEGFFELDVDAIRSRPGDRLAITIQLAVELILDAPENRERLELDPNIGQPLYDTLYYPHRRWVAGHRELEVSRDALQRYLATRMHPVGSLPPFDYTPLTAFDLDFLMLQLRDLVGLLSNLPLLRHKADNNASEIAEDLRVSYAIRSAIPSSDGDGGGEVPLLVQIASDTLIYRWCVDPYGLPYSSVSEATTEIQGLPISEGPPESSLESYRELSLEELLERGRQVKQLDEFVFQLTESLDLEQLATELLFLSPVPAWSHVKTILMHLEEGVSVRKAEESKTVEEERRILADYLRMIERRSQTLERTFAWGVLAGQAYGSGTSQLRALTGLRALAELLRYAGQRTAKELAAALDALGDSLPEEQSIPRLQKKGESPFLEARLFERWKNRFDDWYRGLPATIPIDELQEEAWRHWEKRLKRFFVTKKTTFPPHWADLATAAANTPPGNFLRPPIDTIDLEVWSHLLHLAFREKTGVARWIAAPALIQLGFGASLADCCSRLQRAHGVCEDNSLIEWLQWFQTTFRDLARSRPSAFVLTADEGSLTEGWLPSQRYAALSIPVCRLETADNLFPFAARPRERAHILLIEASLGRRLIDDLTSRWKAEGAVAILVADQSSPFQEISAKHAVVMAPRNLDEAMDQALGLVSDDVGPIEP